jgi:hypothetical protein
MILVVGAVKTNSLLHVPIGSDQLREGAPGGWANDPAEVRRRRAMLIRADDSSPEVDDGAVKINKDGEYGRSWVKGSGYSVLHLMQPCQWRRDFST